MYYSLSTSVYTCISIWKWWAVYLCMNGFHLNGTVFIHGNGRTYKAKMIHSNSEKKKKTHEQTNSAELLCLQPWQGQNSTQEKRIFQYVYMHSGIGWQRCLCLSRQLTQLHWHRFRRRAALQRPPRAKHCSGLAHCVLHIPWSSRSSYWSTPREIW